jgi:hypothetical protein
MLQPMFLSTDSAERQALTGGRRQLQGVLGSVPLPRCMHCVYSQAIMDYLAAR